MAEPATKTEMTEAKQPHPMLKFRDDVNARLAEFRMALPPHMPPEKFARGLVTAVQLNPQLLACDPRSLWNAAMRAAQDGVLPDGRAGAIVPFRDGNPNSPTKGKLLAVWMLMVSGMLTRFRNSGQFRSVMTAVVREGEEFSHHIDENGEHIKHVPGDDASKNIIKAYAIGTTKDGGVMIEVMSRSEIDKRRASSKAPNSPMWKEWYAEAAQKTVLRSLLKVLPQSSDDLERMVARDMETYGHEAITDTASDRRQRITSVTSALEHFGGTETVDAETGEVTTASPPIQPEQNPDEDILIATARERGKQAKLDGHKRTALPPEYREDSRADEAAAWQQGFDQ